LILLYNIFITAYVLGLKIAALWNSKAKEWVKGRNYLFEKLNENISKNDRIIWFHNSSAGEFEQAKPVIEKLKSYYPGYKILVTFFSPSGYNVSKKYTHADYISYLPADTSANAKKFLEIVRPQLVLFVKYDFWHHHLKAVNSENIPLVLISAVFRQNQVFFKWYGNFYKKMLHFFTWIFVQDEMSLSLLKKTGLKDCSISGDTRFDRVKEIAENFTGVPFIKEFIHEDKVVVAGSTWPDDETILAQIANSSSFKFIIAPHEIDPAHVEKIVKEFPEPVLYSQLKNGNAVINSYRTLVIDNVGMLSRLYKYATITYIGGGFTRDGIHNTLEAAVYGKPVIFGPNYHKYREAKELIESGGGFNITTAGDLNNIVSNLMNNTDAYQKACQASLQYINEQTGATEAVMNLIYKNRLLTN
jgi:3-deoxy-D-manno-octulosonic-acid transferase